MQVGTIQKYRTVISMLTQLQTIHSVLQGISSKLINSNPAICFFSKGCRRIIRFLDN
jgi:hypothetical protein